ncbi:hypothetical protein CAEBREN_10328 [Caenorhabditis brenneri]|uniref:Uncharacterized protein n=1 Tax=Caenorhabditis brenneri TaxID=135651 RepID=G0MW81_CAEBE|nr:hypothetical protein CAEBREN_10328 [Caenorhabditis brenneri]
MWEYYLGCFLMWCVFTAMIAFSVTVYQQRIKEAGKRTQSDDSRNALAKISFIAAEKSLNSKI